MADIERAVQGGRPGHVDPVVAGALAGAADLDLGHRTGAEAEVAGDGQMAGRETGIQAAAVDRHGAGDRAAGGDAATYDTAAQTTAAEGEVAGDISAVEQQAAGVLQVTVREGCRSGIGFEGAGIGERLAEGESATGVDGAGVGDGVSDGLVGEAHRAGVGQGAAARQRPPCDIERARDVEWAIVGQCSALQG